MLIEDKREVRLLQELLLEDGELHSDSRRQRLFRWSNNISKFANHNMSCLINNLIIFKYTIESLPLPQIRFDCKHEAEI